MRILLYNPDNGVTRNFMPHLWMFLLKSLTPPEHEVLLIDGNARPMNKQQLVHLLARLCFRGIYVPQMKRRAWFNLIFQNRRSIFTLLRNGVARYRGTHNSQTEKAIAPAMN